MGIFKSFATSGFGDFSSGALRGIAEQGVADAKKNAVFAEDALIKENAEFAKTETAFDNMKEINNIITKNPLAFGITGDNIEQTSDRLVTMMYSEQPSIFEHKNIKDVKMDVAKYFASDLSKPIELSSPYVPSADLFTAEQEKHSASLSAISKMPKTDKLQFNLKNIKENITTPEARTDLETETLKFSAKAYGILNTFPTTELGRTNQNATMSAIVVANARREFPNDATARANFIEKKLTENGIDVLEAVKFQKPVTFRGMVRILDAQGANIASEISRLTNSLAQAETEEQRVGIQSQINQQMMKQYFLINSYSESKTYALAGKDANKIGQLGQITVTPRVDEVEPEKEEQAPGLFRRETKPRRPLKEVLPDFRGDEPEDTGLDAFQASAVDQTPVARQATAVTETTTELANINDFTDKIKKEEGKPFLKAERLFNEKNFTIGYGRNNANVKEGDTITQEQADKFLSEDINVRLKEIQRLIPNFATFPRELQLALFSEYYRGSIRQSPNTVKLINQGRYKEAAGEFLDNEEYRTAEEKGKSGIIGRMKEVFDELNKFGLKTTKAS